MSHVQRGFPEASKVVQVKVHYIGYETTDDAWVSIDMLKCKALSKEKAHPRCRTCSKFDSSTNAQGMLSSFHCCIIDIGFIGVWFV